jgi:hypothetical protein
MGTTREAPIATLRPLAVLLLGLCLLSCTRGAARGGGPDVSRGVGTSSPTVLAAERPRSEGHGHEGDDWESPLP